MVTINDVAQKAGVARPTASLVLGGKHGTVRVPDTTRARVLDAAAQLGYRRNEIARAVISGRNRMLGFLVENAQAEATARMLAGALDEADANGYSIKVLRLAQLGRVDKATIERCVELRLAGVMAIYLYDDSLNELHLELERHAMPIAVLESAAPAWGIGVTCDDEQAMTLAVEHLAGLGHTEIALLTLPGEVFARRANAFSNAMQTRGLSNARVVECRIVREQMDETTRELLLDTARPTAIVGVTDPVAMAVLRVAHELKLGVPSDVSVVGYGDLEMAHHSSPPLSSVTLPFAGIGRAAVRRLLESLRQTSGELSDEPLNESLPSRLNVRSSTGAAP